MRTRKIAALAIFSDLVVGEVAPFWELVLVIPTIPITTAARTTTRKTLRS